MVRGRLRLRRQSLKYSRAYGKAEPFRTEGGKAANLLATEGDVAKNISATTPTIYD